MLLPAFTLQRTIRSKIVSESFWKGCSDRRNGKRTGKGKKRERYKPRQPTNLEELTTLIRANEASETGTATDQGSAENGSMSGVAAAAAAATITPPDHRGNVQQPPAKKSPATAPPYLAPGSLKAKATAGEPAHDETSSPKASVTAAQGNPTSGGAKKRRSDPHRECGDENRKRGGGDGGSPRKHGSGARGVVAVEEAGGPGGGDGAGGESSAAVAPREGVPGLSIQGPSGGRRKHASHGDAAQPESLPKTDVQIEPPQPKIRPSYPVPVDAGGRGVSAWARGGEDVLDIGSDVGGGAAGAAKRRKKRESRVDSPVLAAAKAAAVLATWWPGVAPAEAERIAPQPDRCPHPPTPGTAGERRARPSPPLARPREEAVLPQA
eukprot:g11293.t1